MVFFKTAGGVFSNDCLWKNRLFSDRDPRFVELLCRDVKVEIFRPGETIVTEGSKGTCMYILRRGEVEVSVGGISLAHLNSGSVFGEIALLGVSDRRTATVTTLEFSDCRVVHRKYLKRLLRLFPREREYFEQLAHERLVLLKEQGIAASRRLQESPRNISVSCVKKDVLPNVHGRGAIDKGVDYVTALTELSRFFEKPQWRTGQTKKSRWEMPFNEESRHIVTELPALKDRPPLPPLITRNGVQQSGVNSRTATEDSSEVLTAFQDTGSESDSEYQAVGSGLSRKASSGRGDASPIPRFFMYGRATRGVVKGRRCVKLFTDASIGEGPTPRTLDQAALPVS